jgi:hypothetical protein
MVTPWGGHRIGLHPSYGSNVSDDEAPYEFSVAFSHGPAEVQFYLEAQGDPPSLTENMQAGRALLAEVAGQVGASLGRLREVEDLFFPSVPAGAFTIWIGASFVEGRKPRLKVYLNPQARGRALAPQVVAEAMSRLDLSASWSKVSSALATSLERRDELGIVSLDLSDADDARVKVYVRHHRASIRDIEAFASAGLEHQPEDARVFYSVLANGMGPFVRKPIISEAIFTKANRSGPSSVTFEFPISSYVPTDEVAFHRIVECMTAFELPPDGYRTAVRAFATRPLSERTGMHAHVTLRRSAGTPRIGVYFASEAYVPKASVAP